ncbi:putative bifunctional diguanylate cyclase/phosphodiesterase [Pseudomonas sp. nanlin1]|uniref:putative bifunctional diguanylate cyclase/phosphodiesterase n=1 Tax=Pseudomonas sp. nanlin1 TaxID=3040605 RepID=UPI00388EE5C1
MQRSLRHPLFKVPALLSLSLVTVFLLAALWEFKLEGVVLPALGIEYDGDFELAERWRFIMTSTGFSALSLLLPWLLLTRLLKALRASYVALVEAQLQSESLARHDSLTGLFNRRVLIEHIDSSLARSGQQTVVCLIDLDQFKPINDLYGHAAGDAVICEMAERLRVIAGQWRGIASRLGGDEFALVLDQAYSRAQLAELGQELCSRLAAPLTCMAGKVTVAATVGIALSPTDANTAEGLLQCADGAMYRGKKAGRAVFHFYEAAFDEEHQNQVRFERELEGAIGRNEIAPYYQPIVSLVEHQLVGFEILARWHHPERGLVPPLEFIPIADRLGLIPDMTRSLLHQACTDAQQWPSHLTLAINVNAAMVEDDGFPDRLCAQLDEEGFAYSRLEVEVTEEALVGNLVAARRNLQILRQRGISVALDDFGTGYSGLYHLTKLAIDKIKIDRSFLNSQLDNQEQMVDSILGLGKSLRMKITAEGVEQFALAQWLTEHGCDYAQGYLFGKPMPADQVALALDNPMPALLAMAPQLAIPRSDPWPQVQA